MKIEDLAASLESERVRVTDHAEEEAVADGLRFDDIRWATVHGEVIEDYPKDKPYPSCLVYGSTPQGDPVHSVWAYNEATAWAVLVTVYRPDPKRWVDWRVRREAR